MRKKNGSRSPNKFEFRLPLRLIRDAVLLRFQRPLFRRPVSGPISLTVIGFPHYRLRNIVSVQTRYWSSHPTIVVRLFRSGLRLCFTGFLQSSIERSFYFSCEKQYARSDYLPVLFRSNGSLLTGRRVGLFPSDDLYMTRVCESLQIASRHLSTDVDLSCGKTVLGLWTSPEPRNCCRTLMRL